MVCLSWPHAGKRYDGDLSELRGKRDGQQTAEEVLVLRPQGSTSGFVFAFVPRSRLITDRSDRLADRWNRRCKGPEGRGRKVVAEARG